MNRFEILVSILAAFSGLKGTLTEQEWDYGISIVETEFDSDLERLEAYVKAETETLESKCRAAEKV